MKLLYKAVTAEGKILKGLIEARNEHEAGLYLRRQGILPITITKSSERNLLVAIPFVGKSGRSDLIFFTRQLASMLTSGLTLMQSLRILKEQIEKQTLIDTVSSIIVDIEDGRPLSSALSNFPEMFSPIYISLIKAGETSGLLDKVLTRLADNLEKQARLRSTIQGAFVYPAIVVVGMILAVVVMMVFVVPPLAGLYQSLNVALPLPTRIVITTSTIFIVFWPFLLGGVVGVGVFLRRWYTTEGGKLAIDDLVLRLPIFGKLIRNTLLTELTRTLGLLIGSGTLVVEALHKTAQIVGNQLYKNAMVIVADRVEKGITIGDAMNASALFPPIVVEMVRIGEQTGKLDEQLLRVSDYFEREVDQTVKNLTTILDPILIILLGVGVGFLLISIITPIYGLLSSLQ